VLLLSTVYEGTEFTTRIRKRPTTTHARARAIKHFFGAEPVKEARLLSAAADYNDHMGAVDRGDQLRQQEGLQHRICKGPWRALAWGFLLETALTNAFLLQKNGQPNWKPLRTLHEWREQVCSDLLRESTGTKQAYGNYAELGTQIRLVYSINESHEARAAPAKAAKVSGSARPAKSRCESVVITGGQHRRGQVVRRAM
jgi:hypothetical protein